MPFDSKKTLKTAGKLLAMLFPMVLALVQIPELKYDMNRNAPIAITSLAELNGESVGRGAFAAVAGSGDFDRAFIYQSHGVSYTYFLVKPYGSKLVVRTHRKVTDDWKNLDKFVGKLKRYRRMPFSRPVMGIFKQNYDIDIPAGTLCLLHEDVPAVSGWSVAAMVFSVTLWLVMGYVFFVWRRPRREALTQ